MKDYKLYTPEGVQDYLFQECFNKRKIEQKLLSLFSSYGYNEISTPSFEYFDVFSSGIGAVRQEKTLKFFDDNGRILVLRPDLTMPVARVASVKLKEEPLPMRICYCGSAFGFQSDGGEFQREFSQVGIELIGESSVEADAEVLMLAISALNEAGLKDYKIDIGQVGFFIGLAEHAGLTIEQSEELRGYVDCKDMMSVEMLLRECKVDHSFRDKLMQLPMLYGGSEVLEKAKTLGYEGKCKAAIDNLEDIYRILCDCGYEDNISMDLGILPNLDYYSGTIFRGLIGQMGQPLIAGGRYDNLCSKFGRDIPATGFALGIKRLLIAMESQGLLLELDKADIAIACDKNSRGLAYDFTQEKMAEGKRVSWAHDVDYVDLLKYAEKHKIGRSVYFDAAGKCIDSTEVDQCTR